MKNIGLYLHIPFCKSKCPYCDFYSFSGKDTEKDQYTSVLKSKILSSVSTLQSNSVCKANTLYIGGGTPSVLGAKNLESLVNACIGDFLTDDAEITVECNPHGLTEDFFRTLYECGVNRLSFGLQSAIDSERRILGRLSDREQVEIAVKTAQKVGFENITLDVMLGIPNQTEKSLSETLDFCVSLGVPHISAYMLKLEENTHFYKNQHKYDFPDDDTTADLYLQMCETLENQGIMQYEISNFAKKGFESRHNLKYWHCDEYIGIGLAAHSYYQGARYSCTGDLELYLRGENQTENREALTKEDRMEEFMMMGFRLLEGVSEKEFFQRFGVPVSEVYPEQLKRFLTLGLMRYENGCYSLTADGISVSNSVLCEFLLTDMKKSD